MGEGARRDSSRAAGSNQEAAAEPGIRLWCPLDMACSRWIAVLVLGLGIAGSEAFACTCSGVRGRTAWETAEKEDQISAAIFEGSLERVAVQWKILTARPGEMVRADTAQLLITFRVKRAYKGNLGATVEVSTGLGGGDCGAVYQQGLDYLVYAIADQQGGLAVSMCSPGDWMGSNFISAELRYLRKQRPTSGDLALLPIRSRDSGAEEFKRRYSEATGQICGVISPFAASENARRSIKFLPTTGYSPYWPFERGVDAAGKFCSDRLGPGEYSLQFTKGVQNGGPERLYYAVAGERPKAGTIRVEAGKLSSGVTFQVTKPKTYDVRGLLSVDDKTPLGDNGVEVVLVSPDGRVMHEQTVYLKGVFPLPKTRYFSFDNVLPGQYVAFAFARVGGYLTSVAHVEVTSHSKVVALSLQRTNGNP